jgi:hypothetical protein
MSSQTKKLAVLRSRTDHDLVILVQRELSRGLALADVAMTRTSPFALQAEKALAIAQQLLPRITGLSPEERAQAEAKAIELRSRLDQIPAAAVARFAASRAC